MLFIRRLSPQRLVISLIIAVAVIGLAGPNIWAWHHLRAGRSDLERYHPEEARGHFEKCLKIWPNSFTAHLLACRACRQSGDFTAAESHLRASQAFLETTSDEVALEWALLQASSGNSREVEEFLQWRIEQDPGQSPIVWEALAEGYIRGYRIRDALSLLDHWLVFEPDNLRALELRGLAWQNGRAAFRGSQDFKRVIEKDPTRDATRWRLIHCLLDMGSYDEALPHLEHIARAKPGDAEIRILLARCYNMLGRGLEARRVLDEVLVEFPENRLALRTRGQFALADQQPERAEQWLQQAAQLWPNDYQSQWFLFRALQQQRGRAEEAKAQLARAEAVKARTERVGDLRSRQLSEQPLNPALHYEMGILLIRSGQAADGEGWLLSALSLDPEYQPAHAALADHYEQIGDAAKAAEHRRR